MLKSRRPRSRLAGRAPWHQPSSSVPSAALRADPFTVAAREVIRAIPRGRVATYGQVAHLAGKPWGARQVAWVLHSQSGSQRLPWQRVIGAPGRISLRAGRGMEEQRRLLRAEGIVVDARGRVDLGKYRWRPEGEFPGK